MSSLASLSIGLLFWIGGADLEAASAADAEVATACPAIRVRIDSGSPADRALVCEGAAQARDFFRSHGIEVRQPIRLRVQRQPFDAPMRHIGSYSSAERQITLLAYESIRAQNERDSLFGLPMDRALYRTVVVHELAHAIADQHFKVRPVPLVVQEYLAYVAQLSTMAPDLRHRVLSEYPVPAYRHLDEMSSTYYALDPSGFGVKVYRHFRSLDDPGRFLRDLLSGAIRPVESGLE